MSQAVSCHSSPTNPSLCFPYLIHQFELDRIKECMNRVKDVEAKQKAPKLNKDAAKRFVRSALWQQAQQKTHKTEVGKGGESSTTESAPSGSDEGEPVSKRKK